MADMSGLEDEEGVDLGGCECLLRADTRLGEFKVRFALSPTPPTEGSLVFPLTTLHQSRRSSLIPTFAFKMTATAQSLATSSKTHLTLKGSTAMVSEFFNYSVQSLLYQRGIYPNEDFRQIKKYGLPMLVTTDSGLEKYLNDCLQQVTRWIEEGKLTRLVVAIVEKDSGETRERWQFDLEVTGTGTDVPDGKENVG